MTILRSISKIEPKQHCSRKKKQTKMYLPANYSMWLLHFLPALCCSISNCSPLDSEENEGQQVDDVYGHADQAYLIHDIDQDVEEIGTGDNRDECHQQREANHQSG